MLMRIDPIRELDLITQRLFDGLAPGTWSQPAAMPIDAYRTGDQFVVAFDLPGVDPDAIEIDIDHNILTVKAERRPLDVADDARVHLAERRLGVFSRQLFLGDELDTDRTEASYDNGVLTVRIPVADQAKPRKVEVTIGEPERKAIKA